MSDKKSNIPEVDILLKKAHEAATNKQLDEAAEFIEEALNLEPDNVTGLDYLGFVRFFQLRYEEAEQACRKTLEIKPNHAYAYKGLGLCLARQGDLEQGRASLERAMDLKPKWFDPYWDLAVVLYEAYRYREALDVIDRGLGAVQENEEKQKLESLARRVREDMPNESSN